MVIDGNIETLGKGNFKTGNVRNVYPVTIGDAIYIKNAKGEYVPFTQYVITQDNIGGIVDELLVKYNIISTATTTTTTTEEPVLKNGFYIDGNPSVVEVPLVPGSKIIYVYTAYNYEVQALTAIPQDGKFTVSVTNYNSDTGFATILLTGLYTGMSQLVITQASTGAQIIIPIRVFNPSGTTTTTTSSEEPANAESTTEAVSATTTETPRGNSLDEVLDNYVNS